MTRLDPPWPLPTAILLAYDDGNGLHWLFCGGCERKTLTNPDAKMFFPTECLHVLGVLTEDHYVFPTSVAASEYVIPCAYVTDIDLGPDVDIKPPRVRQSVTWVPPTGRGPGKRAMSLERIESTLSQLGELK